MKLSKNWIQKAVNPKHKGYCTPITKSTCTPKRKALAKRFKAMSKEDGGTMNDAKYKLEMPIVPNMRKENLTMPKYQNGGTLNCDLSKILEIWKK